MSQRRFSGTRLWLGLGLCAMAVLLSGCVYLRLLQLKRQLADFDRNFALETTDGLRLRCLNPVLLSGDIRWLGFAPATVRKIGQAEQWHVRWVKQLPTGATEQGEYEIAFDLTFADNRLTTLSIPETYFALLPKDVFVASLKSLAGAKVDQKQRTVESNVPLAQLLAPSLPNRGGITELLGQPTWITRENDLPTWRYRFLSSAPNGAGGEFDIRLSFDPTSGLLRKLHGRTPVGNLKMDFSPASR
jgi:hypothetical protein